MASYNSYEVLAIRLLYLYSESGVCALWHQEAMHTAFGVFHAHGVNTHFTTIPKIHYQIIHACMYFKLYVANADAACM